MVEPGTPNEATDDTTNLQGLDANLRPFTDIKTRVEDVVDNVVRRHFNSKTYEQRTMQNSVNRCSEEIIKQC